MFKEFVIVVCDVRCSRDDFDPAPKYRCFVNDELFTERTWIWNNCYLEESIQILAKPGKYNIRYELVNPDRASIKFSNVRIKQGSAVVSANSLIHIYPSKNENT
jgi:hypothetical protein